MSRTLCLVIALTSASTVLAQTPPAGIRFDIMPVGCRIHGSFSNGLMLTREYVGKSGDTYIVKTYKGAAATELSMTSTMNADGFAIRNDMPDGKWETFPPYSCQLQLGTCHFTSLTSEGKKRVFKGIITKQGKQIIATGGFVGEKAIAPTTITLSRFNTIESMSSEPINFHVTKYEACGN